MEEREMRPDELARLDDLDDFEIAEDEPDPRGWAVVSADGREIGDIDELIIDTASMKVRYLDCDVDEEELDLSIEDRHVLIPIGYAELDEADEEVRVAKLNADDVSNLPIFQGLPLTRDTEAVIEERFAGRREGEFVEGEREAETPRQRQEMPEGLRVTRSEEELTIDKREVQTGEVEIDKHTETEHVRRPVTRRHDEVEIDRHPAVGASPEGEQFEDEEIHIPLSEEEVDVGKRPEVKEELVVRRRSVEEPDEVEADLRREEIDVEEHGRARRMREAEGREEERGER